MSTLQSGVQTIASPPTTLHRSPRLHGGPKGPWVSQGEGGSIQATGQGGVRHCSIMHIEFTGHPPLSTLQSGVHTTASPPTTLHRSPCLHGGPKGPWVSQGEGGLPQVTGQGGTKHGSMWQVEFPGHPPLSTLQSGVQTIASPPTTLHRSPGLHGGPKGPWTRQRKSEGSEEDLQMALPLMTSQAVPLGH